MIADVTASLGTDFYRMDDLLTPAERAVRDKVRAFCDAEVLPIEDIVRAGERAGFEVRDVEALREHSALTLEAWGRRLEQHHAECVRAVGEVTYRVWRAYMGMSAYLFRCRRLSLYHTLCVKAAHGCAGVPLTREEWYEPLPAALSVRKDAA